MRVGLVAAGVVALLVPLAVSPGEAAGIEETCRGSTSLGSDQAAECGLWVPYCADPCGYHALRITVQASSGSNGLLTPEVRGVIAGTLVCSGQGSCQGILVVPEFQVASILVKCRGSGALPNEVTALTMTCDRARLGTPATCTDSTALGSSDRAKCTIFLPACGSSCPTDYLFSVEARAEHWLDSATPRVNARVQDIAECSGTMPVVTIGYWPPVGGWPRCSAAGMATSTLSYVGLGQNCEAWGASSLADALTALQVTCMRFPSPY